MSREKGFYFVTVKDNINLFINGRTIVAEWKGNCWEVCGDSCYYTDEDFTMISEKRLIYDKGNI